MKMRWNSRTGFGYESFPAGDPKQFKEILLDGKAQELVVAIDTEAGLLWKYTRKPDGDLALDADGEGLIEQRSGCVETIAWPDKEHEEWIRLQDRLLDTLGLSIDSFKPMSDERDILALLHLWMNESKNRGLMIHSTMSPRFEWTFSLIEGFEGKGWKARAKTFCSAGCHVLLKALGGSE